MNTFTRILKLIGIRVKATPLTSACPCCGNRAPAQSDALHKAPTVRLPRLSDPNFDPNDTQRR
jgi:hypothetical protein